MSENVKLNPIYVALDAHDYRRAVKLCLALPKAHHLGQALLAHALIKSGQQKKCIGVLKALLGPGWKELDKMEGEPLGDSATPATAVSVTAPTGTTAASAIKGKKAKGKQPRKAPSSSVPLPTAAVSVSASAAPEEPVEHDVIVHLSPPPTCNAWKDTDPPILYPAIFSDDTTVETLALTLHNLRLVETSYYLWKLSGFSLRRQFIACVHMILAKSDTSMLPTLQIVALQVARSDPNCAKWAAVVALWQLHWMDDATDGGDDDVKSTAQRRAMLPRLAESLASKSVQSAEEFWLLQAAQSDTLLEWLDQPPLAPTRELIPLGAIQRLEMKAACFQKMMEWQKVIAIYQELLTLQPDQWSYWKALAEAGFQDTGMEGAARVVEQALTSSPDTTAHRSHLLIHCEVAAMGIRKDLVTDTDALFKSVQDYVTIWACKASCTFSDIEAYLDLLLATATEDKLTSVYDWASTGHQQHTTIDDRSNLRAYICSIQVLYKLVQFSNIASWLPDWRAIFNTWRGFSSAKSIQKENQPADELILLAVQGLLYGSEEEQHLLMAATLLEMGKTKSPYNPYFKIQLLQVYAKLQAYDESWSMFRELGIKHVQIDSCTFLIMDHLLDGGMYQQACLVAGEIMKFHSSALRDAGDFIGTAMQEGNFSKADDFIKFQLNRMSPSLAVLEARGIVLDCAPTMEGQMGITGQESDLEIATSIATQVNSVFGAPSLLVEKRTKYSDNRDSSILDFQILTKHPILSEEAIVAIAMRRKAIHGMLVRAVLILDATKPLKKGKLVASSASLKLRSQSLLDVIEATNDSDEWVNVMKSLCSTIVLVCCGMPENGIEDSPSTREERAMELLQSMSISNITEWTRPAVCRFLCEYLVAINALLETLAKAFSLFGWGKRKQRASVAVLAKVAADLGTLVSSIKTSYVQAPIEVAHCDEIIDNAIHALVVSKVRACRSSPRTEYVVSVLEDIERTLASFTSE
jgi:tetratricopeptide (TPR) repeat protein